MTPDGEERERTVEEEEGRVNVQGQKEETIKRVEKKEDMFQNQGLITDQAG